MRDLPQTCNLSSPRKEKLPQIFLLNLSTPLHQNQGRHPLPQAQSLCLSLMLVTLKDNLGDPVLCSGRPVQFKGLLIDGIPWRIMQHLLCIFCPMLHHEVKGRYSIDASCWATMRRSVVYALQAFNSHNVLVSG